MRNRWLVACMALLVVGLSIDAGLAKQGKPQLKTAEFLPHDALFAGSMQMESLSSVYDAVFGFMAQFVPEEEVGALMGPLEEWEQEVGVSLRDDVLALLGGEAAFAISIDDIDRTSMIAMSMSEGGGPPDLGSLLGGLMFTVGVFDPERFDSSMAKILQSVGARLSVDSDGLRTLHAPAESGMGEILHYRYHAGFAVLSFSPDTIAMAVARYESGGGLRTNPEFREVFAHLDESPDAFGYLNLHRVQELFRNSNLLRMGVAQMPEMSSMYSTIVDEWEWGSGIGWASYDVEGGTVQQTFAPFDMSAFAAAYGGIVAAVAVPNFLSAVDRGKQKRTMADLRSLATSVEAFAVDNNQYPIVPEMTPVGESALAELLSPMYIRDLPTTDGWGNVLYYQSNEDGTGYTLYSFGKDGEPTEGSEGPTTSFASDIVFHDGSFTAWPEGTQN